MQVNREVISDRRVRAFLVIISTPSLQLFAGIRKGQEPMSVQALRPQLAVEGLDEAVVGRLARSWEVQGDVVGMGPQVEVSGDELAAVIHPDRLRIAGLPADAFQGLDDILAAIGEACIGGRAVARVGVDHGQDTQLFLPVASWS